MTPARRRGLVGALSVVLSAALVALLLARIDLAQAAATLRGADRGWLALAALLTALMPVTATLRWRGVLRALPDAPPGFGLSLRAVLLANALNAVLPSKAGDVAKAAYLRRHGGRAQGVGTVVLERLVDLAVLGALAVAGGLVSGAAWSLLGVALLGGVAVVLAALARLPAERLPLPAAARAKLGEALRVVRLWGRAPGAAAQTVAASLATWLAGGLLVAALARAFGAALPLPFVLAVFPAAILAGLVPLTVSGIGTRDAAFVALLAGRVDLETATLIALGYTVFAYWLLALLGLPALGWAALRRPRRPRRRA